MKRAKIMLMAIIAFAIVGGALAFKTQKFGSSKYCYLTTDEEPPIGPCTYTAVNASSRPWLPTEPKIYYTTTNDATPVKCAQMRCPFIGIPDQQ